MKKINKQGKLATGTLILIAIALVAIWFLNIGGVQQLVMPKATNPQGGTGTTINTVNPVISVTALDKGASGTVVGITGPQASFNSGGFKAITLGTDTAVPGQTLDLFLTNGTTYHNAYFGVDIASDNNVALSSSTITVSPTSFPVTVSFNKNASVTENIFGTTGLVLTNNGATQNQTKLGNGATYNLKDAMSGTSLANTQDMVCIVEVQEGANVSTQSGAGVTLNGVAPYSTAKPSWYTVNSSGSNVYLFNMAPLSSGAEVDQNLQIVNGATKQFSANTQVLKTCYTKEYFIDANTGKVTYDIADSNGNLKSMAQYYYRFYFE